MPAPTTIAIVGGGPRGLWAVEELSAAITRHGGSWQVTVFDPQPLGTGAAYDPAQPGYRLLNLYSHRVTSGMGTLRSYLAQQEGVPKDTLPLFPACAQVGAFLAASWQHTLNHLPAGLSVRHEQRTITDPAQLTGYDAVLLVTGHRPNPAPAGMLPAYGNLNSISPGSTVAVRGAALSAVDVILDLTLGRGGTFTPTGYRPSGREPATIYPLSRSGTFIPVKPEPSTEQEKATIARFAGDIEAATSPAALQEVLEAAASAVYGSALTLADAAPDLPPYELMRATLTDPRRPAQIFGLVWRELYPHTIHRASLGRLPLSPEFLALVSTLKPLAFGPPAPQLHRLLALADTGILDFSALGSQPPADVIYTVNAVLAPGGVHPGSLEAGVLAHLQATDQALFSPVTDPASGAARTDAVGVIDVRGRWAIIGRATEPYVLGNDTLSRTNHRLILRWAERTVTRILSQ